MKTLILGIDGMLGHVMAKSFLLEKSLDVYGVKRLKTSSKSALKINSNKIFSVNILDEKVLHEIISNLKPNYVINCSGIVKQSNYINDYVNMISMNSLLPHKLAKICDLVNAKLIHFSTDCVFSGKKGFYQEFDKPDAEENYGRSKYLGEVNYGNTITLSGAGSSSGQINFIPSASNSSAVALTLDSSQNATFVTFIKLGDT